MKNNAYFCSVKKSLHSMIHTRPALFAAATVLLMLLAAQPAGAQSCQGFQNPANFNYVTGSTGRWTARVGDRIVGTGGSTGSNILSTCSLPTATVISGHTNITSSQYYSGTCSYTDGVCHHTFYDAHDHRFSIYRASENGGLDEFTINGSNGLPRVPPGFSSSIRLGDMRSTGQSVYPTNLSAGNGRGSEALFYSMLVRPATSLIFINYAVVARRFDHSPQQAGEFVIRVVGKNPTTHEWNNFPLTDSLWYCVPAPEFSSSLPAPWVEGRPGAAAGGTTCGYCYKPWTKVALNLSDYLYDSVRIEMYTSDCIYNVDPIYAYITGSCQALNIAQHGCVSGSSNAIDTLHVPSDLISYAWYVSTTGYAGGAITPSSIEGIRFRSVASTTNTHVAIIPDFVITEGPNQGDTAAEQLYKCVVTSALDPAKPFHTDLYAAVRNTRPVIDCHWENQCNGTVNFHAVGRIPYQGIEGYHIVDSLTQWVIHEGGPYTPPLDTIYGIDASYFFTDTNTHSFSLTMFSSEEGCSATRWFQVTSRPAPPAVLDIANHNICEGDTAVLTDRSTRITYRKWIIGDTVIETRAPALESSRVVRLTFTQAVNPVTLIVADASGCADTTYDTIYYFAPGSVFFSSDTIVCKGQGSHVKVSTPINGCTFAWYRTLDPPDGQPFMRGNTLRVALTDSVATYYVKVTTPQGCVQWDSVTLHLAALTLTAEPSHANICPGDTVTLTAGGALSYRWLANPPDPALDSHATDVTIRVSPSQTTTYTLTGLAADSCSPTPLKCRVVYVPLPEIDVDFAPRIVNADEPVVRFTDISAGRAESDWIFPDSVVAHGESVSYRFDINGEDSVAVGLISYNRLHCPSDTAFFIPVKRFTFWCPNIFSPYRPTNNRFAIINTYPMEVFHIYIYNRFGALVYQSDDPDFQWDGTCNGTPCPQGTYNYRISYIPLGDKRENVFHGTVTLLR